MRRKESPATAGLLLFALLVFALPVHAQGDAKRGEYLAKAGGCLGCHTSEKKSEDAEPKGQPYAGGRSLTTPFGVFYGPNITPHPSAGIGRWSEADFIEAMRLGVRPDGSHYYPVFPYTSFTRIVDQDLKDLWAYLRSLPASPSKSRPHALRLGFDLRFLMAGWKWLFFEPAVFKPEPARSEQLNRGAYLTDALGHCGECHTPRNIFGARKTERYLAGATLPDGVVASNLTPSRLKRWSDEELKDFLKFGLTPDGDVTGETMGEVIRNTTSQLSDGDLAALIAHLRSLPPLPDASK